MPLTRRYVQTSFFLTTPLDPPVEARADKAPAVGRHWNEWPLHIIRSVRAVVWEQKAWSQSDLGKLNIDGS